MTRYIALLTFLFSLLAFAVTPQAQDTGEPAREAWTLRCTDEETTGQNTCEIFQRLVAKETGQRVTEFAIGFPPGESTARGIIVLPLGVLLTEDPYMDIDDGEFKFKFQVRYCSSQGCYAVVQLNDKLLDVFKRSGKATIYAKDMQGNEFAVPMSLMGFTKALSQISG